MRPPQRPTALTVLAILYFVYGGLALTGALCNILSYAFADTLMSLIPKMPGMADMKTMMIEFQDSVPGMTAYTLLDYGGGFVLAVMMIVAGIGLLKVKPWARPLSLVWAILKILVVVGTSAYAIAYLNPAIVQMQLDMQEEIRKQSGAPAMPGGFESMMKAMASVGTIVGALFFLVLPAATLAILRLTPVRAAFARTPPRPLLDAPEDLPADERIRGDKRDAF